MIFSAVLAAIVFVVTRFVVRRYSTLGNIAQSLVASGALLIFLLGFLSYPALFEGSLRAAFPPQQLPPTASVPASPSVADTTGRPVHCPARVSVARATAKGAIDSVFVESSSATQSVPAAALVDVPPGGKIDVKGWIANDDGPAESLCVIVDDRPVTADIQYGIRRDDVATALGKSEDAFTGYAIQLVPTTRLGLHSLSIGAVSADGKLVTPLAVAAVRIRTH